MDLSLKVFSAVNDLETLRDEGGLATHMCPGLWSMDSVMYSMVPDLVRQGKDQ